MTFECVIVVVYNGWRVIQEAPEFVQKELFGPDVLDNDFRNAPTEPGIYRCEVGMYEYDQGYSECFYVVRNAVKLKLIPDEDAETDHRAFLHELFS